MKSLIIYNDTRMEEEDNESNLLQSQVPSMNTEAQNARRQADIEKRVKERSICYVVKKVQDWRRCYEVGVDNPETGRRKLSLDESANYVRLSRKTLDDYYAQIRRGQQLGFDFEANKEAKMGTLRKFVRERRLEEPGKLKDDLVFDIHQIYSQYSKTL